MVRNKTLLFVGIFIGVLASGFYFYLQSEPAFETCASPSDIDESSVVVLTDREYFPPVLEALNNAQNTLDISLFEMRYYTSKQYKDSNENKLVEAVANASRRGVKVRVYLDEYDENVYLTEALLKRAGVDVKMDSPKITTHTKLIIIDGEIVIVGSTNWSYFALEKNHEASILIKSKAVAEKYTAYFERLWNS